MSSAAANGQSALQRVSSPFRAAVPQLAIEVDRTKAESLHVSVQQVFDTLTSYLGSTYINQFNKFGRTFQVYTQADSQFRVQADGCRKSAAAQSGRQYDPARDRRASAVGRRALADQPLQSLSVLDDHRLAGCGLQLRPGDGPDGAGCRSRTAAGTGYDWTAMSYQEKIVGGQMYLAFGLALLLVYLVLAGQYESWLLPLSVILAVPLSLVGPVIGLHRAADRQQPLCADRPCAADRPVCQECHPDRRICPRPALEGKDIVEAAREAARARFRPILMTSFAFILGVVPLVFAEGAGANARKSIGITVFTGMLASTCLAVLFVPAFYVIVQTIQERRKAKKHAAVPRRPRHRSRSLPSFRQPGTAARPSEPVCAAPRSGCKVVQPLTSM